MEITGVQIFLLVIVAAVVGMGSVLDSFQTHRPLIACTLVGIILGDVTTGVILGGTLEFIALGWMNIGAAQSPDSALASIISTILVIVGSQSIGTGIAIALPVAAAGQVLTVIARTVTVFFQHAADRYAEDVNFRMIDICHVSALLFRHCALRFLRSSWRYSPAPKGSRRCSTRFPRLLRSAFRSRAASSSPSVMRWSST